MQAYCVTNNGEHPRRFGGEWVAPGEVRVIEMRPLPDIVIAKWRRAGVRIVATNMPVAAPNADADPSPMAESVAALSFDEEAVEMWSEPQSVEDDTAEDAPKPRKGKRRKTCEGEA